MEDGAALSIDGLPESCLSHALSFTSPRDACRAAPTSSSFRRAADADAVWERFLPPDLPSILSRAADPASLAALSKKELYLHALSHPVLIDGGKMSFQLETTTEKNHFMVSARGLEIVDGDNPHCWKWAPAADSRFSEVVQLVEADWMEMHGKIDATLLSPKTSYAAFLVFKIAEDSYGLDILHRATTRLVGCWESDDPFTSLTWLFGLMEQSTYWKPELATGGEWLELELGSFYVDGGEEGDVEVCLMEMSSGKWKRGLVVHGIEFRPSIESPPSPSE